MDDYMLMKQINDAFKSDITGEDGLFGSALLPGMQEDQSSRSAVILHASRDMQEITDAFSRSSEKKRSESFVNLRRAVIGLLPRLSNRLKDKKPMTGQNQIENFLILREAAQLYKDGHLTAKSREGIKWRDYADRILQYADQHIRCELKARGINAEVPDPGEVTKEELSDARWQVKRLARYYRAYSKRVGEDLLATDHEKLIRRWNVLKSCSRYIEICIAHGNKVTGSEEENLLDDYMSIKRMVTYMSRVQREKIAPGVFLSGATEVVDSFAQKITGHRIHDDEEKDTEDDGTLSEEQKAGVAEIDTWVVRNFQNGGYMALFGSRTDRKGIVDRLMSMSRKKRLFIYYLVESRERVNPSLFAFLASQTDYTPTLTGFKNHMVSNCAKFYSRFSGGYIYWHKLRQAMSIADNLEDVSETLSDSQQETSEEPEEMKDVRAAVGKTTEYSVEEDIDTYANRVPMIAYGLASNSNQIMTDAGAYTLGDGTGSAFLGATEGLNAVGRTVNIYFTAKNLYKSHKNMTYLDITSSGTGMATSSYRALKSGATVVDSVKDVGVSGVTIFTSKTISNGVTAADVAIAGVKTASYFKGRFHRNKATELLKDKADQNKYDEGMMRLEQKLDNTHKVTTGTSLLLAGAAVTATLIPASAPFIFGASVFVGIAEEVFKNRRSRGMLNVMFDACFEVDSCMAKLSELGYIKPTYTDKQLKLLRNQVKKRIATSQGFYSIRDAGEAVAGRFAAFLLTRAHAGDESSEAYIQLIKGLGLKYRYEEGNEKKNAPTFEVLKKKLCTG